MKIVITVPGHLTCHERVEAELHCLMKLAGGVTVCPAQGQWVAPDGRTIIEPVEQYHFCFIGPEASMDHPAKSQAVRDTVRAIIDAGEEAVLVESYSRSYCVNMYTAKDFQ